MRRLRAACFLILAGCTTGPMFDNPMRVSGEVTVADETGAIVPSDRPPGEAYAELFDSVLDAVDDYFPIAYSNRYEGRVLGAPTHAPGINQFWKPGSSESYERLLVTLQAYRYRCEVRIREAEPAGYFVQVAVYKELRDYAQPSGVIASVPVFGEGGTVDREQFLVVDPDVTSPIVTPGERWIPKGRETSIEQEIIRKLRKTH
jgi:hypothetical protein